MLFLDNVRYPVSWKLPNHILEGVHFYLNKCTTI